MRIELGSNATEVDIAIAICAAQNGAPGSDGSSACSDITVAFPAPAAASSRASRDHVNLLVDRAVRHIYPQVDPRDYASSVKHGTTGVIEVLVRRCGNGAPIRAVEALGYVLNHQGEIVEVEEGAVTAARKAMFKATKEHIKLARAAVRGFTYRASSRRPVKVFASGQGVIVVCTVAAVCDHYAYLAMPLTDAIDSQMLIVGKISKLRCCEGVGLKVQRALPGWLEGADDVHSLRHVSSVRYFEAVSSSFVVEVVSHRVRLTTEADQSWRTTTIEIDDCGVVASVSPCGEDVRERLSNVQDTVAAVGAALTAEVAAECDANAEIIDQLRCTGEDPFRVAPSLYRMLRRERDARWPLQSVKSGETLPFEEGCCVEFKYKVNVWNADDAASLQQTSTERLRQIIAAMANTEGGIILIGISDDGVVHGAESIAKHLRTSQFAPAMTQDAISVHELPVADPKAPSGLSTQWWKAPAGTSTKADATPATTTKVVTVIRVMKSLAPYHLTGPTVDTAPMARGAASTVALSITCMVNRLAEHFARRQALKRANSAQD